MTTTEMTALLVAATAFLAGVGVFYRTVFVPGLAEVKALILALRENTTSTDKATVARVEATAALEENSTAMKAAGETIGQRPLELIVHAAPVAPAPAARRPSGSGSAGTGTTTLPGNG